MIPRNSVKFPLLGFALLLSGGALRPDPGYGDIAIPARRAELPEPIRAMLVFAAFPKADGSFEVEVAVESRYPIADVKLRVQHTDDVILAAPLEYAGPLEAGRLKAWRVKGTFPPTADPPAAVSLMVDYAFPRLAMEREVRETWVGEAEAPVLDRLLAELAQVRKPRVLLVRSLELVPREMHP